MSIGVFIDLNAYRITKFTLQLLQGYLQQFRTIDYHYYNYSKSLHGKLKLNGTKYPAISGRRKVLIDVRLTCDVVEYATRHDGGNVLLLCSYVDSEPLFDTLRRIGTHIALACAQRPNIQAQEYITLERGGDNIVKSGNNGHIHTACDKNISIDSSSHATKKDIANSSDTLSITPSIANTTITVTPHKEQDYDAQLQAIDVLLAKLSL